MCPKLDSKDLGGGSVQPQEMKSTKLVKDEQRNHSKIVREIEDKLNKMQWDFNVGIIIQMSLDQKL